MAAIRRDCVLAVDAYSQTLLEPASSSVLKSNIAACVDKSVQGCQLGLRVGSGDAEVPSSGAGATTPSRNLEVVRDASSCTPMATASGGWLSTCSHPPTWRQNRVNESLVSLWSLQGGPIIMFLRNLNLNPTLQLPFPFTRTHWHLPVCVALREGSTGEVLHALRHSEPESARSQPGGRTGTDRGNQETGAGGYEVGGGCGGVAATGSTGLGGCHSDSPGPAPGSAPTASGSLRETQSPSQAFASFANEFLESLLPLEHRIAVGYGIVSYDVVSRVDYVARLLQEAAGMASTPRYAVHVVMFVSDELPAALEALQASTIARYMTTLPGSGDSEVERILEHVSVQVRSKPLLCFAFIAAQVQVQSETHWHTYAIQACG